VQMQTSVPKWTGLKKQFFSLQFFSGTKVEKLQLLF
jgi:hypothetical protein